MALPFADASFDLVLCQQGLQFFPDRPAAVRQMHRVLTPSGRVVLSVSRGLEHQPIYAALNAAIERHLGVAAMAAPFSLGDAEELRALLVGAGFLETVIESMVRTVRFPSPQQFVRLSVLGAAAAVPDLGRMEETARDSLIDAIRHDISPTLQRYTDGAGLAFPLAVNVAAARAAYTGDEASYSTQQGVSRDDARRQSR